MPGAIGKSSDVKERCFEASSAAACRLSAAALMVTWLPVSLTTDITESPCWCSGAVAGTCFDESTEPGRTPRTVEDDTFLDDVRGANWGRGCCCTGTGDRIDVRKTSCPFRWAPFFECLISLLSRRPPFGGKGSCCFCWAEDATDSGVCEANTRSLGWVVASKVEPAGDVRGDAAGVTGAFATVAGLLKVPSTLTIEGPTNAPSPEWCVLPSLLWIGSSPSLLGVGGRRKDEDGGSCEFEVRDICLVGGGGRPGAELGRFLRLNAGFSLDSIFVREAPMSKDGCDTLGGAAAVVKARPAWLSTQGDGTSKDGATAILLAVVSEGRRFLTCPRPERLGGRGRGDCGGGSGCP